MGEAYNWVVSICLNPFQVLLNVTLIFLNLETPSVKNLKMGRRRSKRKPPPKVKPVMPLDQLFNCPFCNHEKSCDVKMDRQRNIATIRCQVCVEDYQTSINYLSEPVDVYSDWIDACEQANTWNPSKGLSFLAISINATKRREAICLRFACL